MRTLTHYQKILSGNPDTTIGFTLAADMIYAARHGMIKRSEAHGSDEWKTIARNLKSRYGENLTVDDVRAEMSPQKIAAAALGSVKSPKKAEASSANGAKGGRPRTREYYTVTSGRFHGEKKLYQGPSLTQAVRTARKHDCTTGPSQCKCGGPQIQRASDGAMYLNWHAAKPFQPANDAWWEVID